MVNTKIGNNSSLKYSLRERILKLLIENKRAWTILEISNELKCDYKNTFQAVNKLYPDLIYKSKKGNINLVEIKITPLLELLNVENKRAKEFLDKHKKINLVKEDIEILNYPYFIVLLYGSYVKNSNTERSDIDICAISDNKEKSRELISKFRLLSMPLEIQDFNVKEFESMLDKKENNLAKEIIKNNIILFGTENYYNLISKWMNKE